MSRLLAAPLSAAYAKAARSAPPTKITRIETVYWKSRDDAPFWPHWTWVKIDTDSGVSGIGETYPRNPAEAAVVHSSASSLLGHDPRDIERIWADLYRAFDFQVAGGAEIRALSAIDLALWDLLGKHLDVIADAGPSTADIKVYKDVTPGPDNKIHLEFLSNNNQPFLNAIEILPGIPGKMRPYRVVAREHGLKDNEGRNWDPDRYARGGQLIQRPDSNIQNADPELFRSERFGNLTYSIPVPAQGRYSVNLYFSENWFGPGNPGGGGVGSRTFDILVNGVMVRKQFDILRESGANNRAAIVSLHSVEPNHQGKIVVSLSPIQNYACINALEVLDESR